MKKQKLILLLAIMTAFATALFLPGLVRADVIVIVDNDDPEATIDPEGNWATHSGYGYGVDCRSKAEGTGTGTATWTPEIPVAGDYNVYAWWIEGGSRATNAPYTITYDGGSETIRVNQKATGTGGQWNLLGTYPFAAGTAGSVVLSDGPGADGAVIADAVSWFAVVPGIVDNPNASVVEGDWSTYSGGAPKYGVDCFVSEEVGVYDDKVVWIPEIPANGDYNVYAWWISGGTRATNAPYEIWYDGGSETVRVNQKATNGQWNLLGTYRFVAGTSGKVKLRAGPNADGVVIADAIMINRGHVGMAQVEKTGQQVKYRNSGDGDLQKGVIWPCPRFTDNEDGTVTDNLTDLMWTKDANIYGTRNWYYAVTAASNCVVGAYGDWRLPNVRELSSLIHFGYYDPALPNTVGTGQGDDSDPFTNVQSDYYWSSTTDADSTSEAHSIEMEFGDRELGDKATADRYVWPVRDGQ